eukprot:scaffold434_cov186-Pinguiococcus_pyrenoidosus.AAC.130
MAPSPAPAATLHDPLIVTAQSKEETVHASRRTEESGQEQRWNRRFGRGAEEVVPNRERHDGRVADDVQRREGPSPVSIGVRPTMLSTQSPLCSPLSSPETPCRRPSYPSTFSATALMTPVAPPLSFIWATKSPSNWPSLPRRRATCRESAAAVVCAVEVATKPGQKPRVAPAAKVAGCVGSPGTMSSATMVPQRPGTPAALADPGEKGRNSGLIGVSSSVFRRFLPLHFADFHAESSETHSETKR